MNAPRFSLSHLSPVIIALVITLAYAAGRIVQWQWYPEHYYLLNDPDVLLRLTLIREWLQGGQWQDHVLMRMNAPFGLETPWTRVVDMLALLCSTPFLAFFPVETALVLGSFIYSTAAVLLLVWIAARIVRETGGFPYASLLLGFGVVLYPSLLQYMQPANIDHHSLLIVLTLALTYGVAKLSSRSDIWPTGLSLGAVMGIGIWTSVEFQLMSGLLFAWLGWQWILCGKREWLVQMMLASAATAFLLTITVLSEHPASRFFSVVYDSVSFLHIALFGGIAIASSLLYSLATRVANPISRFALAGLTAALLLALLLHYFPLLPKGPMAQVSPAMQKEFLSEVMEMTTPFEYGVGIGIAYLFFGLLCLPGVWLIRRQVPASPYLQFLLFGTLVFLILAALAVRMASYLGPLSILLLIHIIHLLQDRPRWHGIIGKPAAILALAFSPLYLGSFSDSLDSLLPARNVAANQDMEMGKCHQDLIRLTESGKLKEVFGDAPKTLLGYGNWGPYLLWRTPYSIVMANYHRDEQGYLEGLTVLRWKDAEKAHHILRTRQVAGLILCVKEAKPGLAHMLAKQPMAGFIPVPGVVPEHSDLRLYRVDPDALRHD